MDRLVLLNKPYGVLSQFRVEAGQVGVGSFISDPTLRIAGRLDSDSEGLLVLTNSGTLNHAITNPSKQSYKTYNVQVEGQVSDSAISALASGVLLKDGWTLPARVKAIAPPCWLWPRNPPVRFRANIPTSWLEISICEGKNRQIRRMTASVGLPTLRLIRCAVMGLHLNDLNIAPGQHLTIAQAFTNNLLASQHKNLKKP
jgi:23S rRNA pseudouridine2457 synthase